MKLRELINRLEEISEDGKNDNLNIVIQSECDISDHIEDIYLRNSVTGRPNVVIGILNL